jgi:tetratricopeptide (TPR) repeat protein
MAIEYFKKAIALQQESDMEAELSISLNYLALLYKSQGRYLEAEPLYLQAVEIFRSKLPENHPNVLLCWKNYVELWREGISKEIFTFEQLQEHPFGEQLLAELQE